MNAVRCWRRLRAACRRCLARQPLVAWMAFVLSLGMTAAGWALVARSVEQRTQDRFAFEAEDLRLAVQRRMQTYELVLRGAAGLFNAAGRPDRHQWQAYFDTIQLARHYPGIEAVGFNPLVAAEQKEAHQQQVRAEGFADYAIQPAGERPFYTPVLFLAPFDERNQRAFGYDTYADAARRSAMERARDTGQASLTGRLVLMQESDADRQYGVLMFMPLYRPAMPLGSFAERRVALAGFVSGAFRMDDLMRGILGAGRRQMAFDIYDGTMQPESLLQARKADSPAYSGVDSGEALARQMTLDIGGRIWILNLRALPDYVSPGERALPLIAAGAGVIVSVLLLSIVGALARQRQRATAIAARITRDLQHSNEELEQFAYAASHDMRQPLRMVTSYLQLVERGIGDRLDEHTRAHLATAIEGARRMDRMIIDLLEFSRVGRQQAAMERLVSRTLVDETLKILEPEISAAAAKVEVHGHWPKVVVCRDQVLRLLQNLIGNALKFRASGEAPRVDIVSAADRLVWRVEVRDRGIGVVAAQADQLFKVFSRLNLRSEYDGSGIGLALCRKIVDQHGGRIGVSSDGPGKGASFWFEMPIAPDDSAGEVRERGDE